jgi:hypothetical protein
MESKIEIKNIAMKRCRGVRDKTFASIQTKEYVDAKRSKMSQSKINNASYSEHIGKIPTNPR